ncbi:MAG: cadherin repeat domain-containing protein [Opitutales bacterium]|nr:cadherin repeat domain-containing protein [Opitutales bacterium]
MKTLPNLKTCIAPLLAASALWFMPAASAETLLYEGFDMPPGDLDNQAGATSFGWRMEDGEELRWWSWEPDEVGFSLYHGVTADGLSYPGVPSVGGAFYFENEEQQANNVVHRMIPGYLSYYGTSGQRWVSVLMNAKIDGDPEFGGWFQFTFSDPIAQHNSIYMGISNNSTLDQTVWSAGGERLYENGVQGAKWSLSSVPVVDGETVFLVMKLDFDWKTAAWWVNPDPHAEDPGPPVAEFTMLTDLAADRVMLRVLNNGPSQLRDDPEFETQGLGADYTGTRIDEIRMGRTYQSVAAGATMDPGDVEPAEPPVITGPFAEAGAETAEATIVEGTVRVGTMTSDIGAIWSISGGADGDLFTIGTSAGGLSFQQPPSYADPMDADGDNVYVVEVTAANSDDTSEFSTQTIFVTVVPGWGGIPGEDGYVNVGMGYLGWVYFPLAPWLYNADVDAFFYLEQDEFEDEGSWAYFVHHGNVEHVEGNWYYSHDLMTWAYLPEYEEGTASWGFWMNAAYEAEEEEE